MQRQSFYIYERTQTAAERSNGQIDIERENLRLMKAATNHSLTKLSEEMDLCSTRSVAEKPVKHWATLYDASIRPCLLVKLSL